MRHWLALLAILFLASGASAQTNTFCPVNQNCTITGNWIFTSPLNATNATNLVGPGTVTGNYTSSGTWTQTGPFNCTIVNAVPCISPSNPQGWAGADVCAWITSAQASLPSTGGRVQVASGAYSACAAGFTVGRFSPARPVMLYIDATTIIVNAQVIVEGGSGIVGVGSNSIQIPTTIQAGASFPINTALIQVDKLNAVQQEVRLIDFASDCFTTTGCTNFDMGGSEDGTLVSGVFGYRYSANSSTGVCFNLPNAGGGAIAQLNVLFNVQCQSSSTATSSNAITMNAVADNFLFERLTLVPLSAGQQAAGIVVTGPLTALDVHCEKLVDCIQFSGTSAEGSVTGVNTTNTVTTGVHILSTVTGSISIQQVQQFSATNAVKNDIAAFNHVCTDQNLASYEINAGSPISLRTSCASLTPQLMNYKTFHVAGTPANPSYSWQANPTSGFSNPGSGYTRYSSAGSDTLSMGGAGLFLDNGVDLVQTNGDSFSGTADTNLGRISAGLWGMGTGAHGSFAGSLKLTGLTAVGTARSSVFISDQGTACTNGELALSAGWGTTAAATAVQGQGQTCTWTITASGTGQGLNPTITDTLTNALPSASVVGEMTMHGGTGANTLLLQTTLSATAPVWTLQGTPGAGLTYIITRRMGP